MPKFLNHHGVVIEGGETIIWHEFEFWCTHSVTMENLLLSLYFLLICKIEITIEPISRTK